MIDYVKYCREQADETFYDPLKESWTMVGNRIEKLEAALTHIWAWYPINVSQPHETIDAIKDFAFATIKGEQND
jgi:hypothetical protein